LTLEFEGIEVHSRKVFNEVKEKKANAEDGDDPIGPMVSECSKELIPSPPPSNSTLPL
jgi:hypothetical protein